MKILIAAASLVLVHQIQPTATIQPGQIEEACTAMAAGERLEFSFSANTGLDFNIHYHDDKEIHLPVNKSALSEWTSSSIRRPFFGAPLSFFHRLPRSLYRAPVLPAASP